MEPLFQIYLTRYELGQQLWEMVHGRRTLIVGDQEQQRSESQSPTVHVEKFCDYATSIELSNVIGETGVRRGRHEASVYRHIERRGGGGEGRSGGRETRAV